MIHHASPDDLQFLRAFEACETDPATFDHAGHVRLAYVYLCAHPVEAAAQRMKEALLGYLTHLGVGPAKYHETITRAWLMAVDHFMTQAKTAYTSADEFMADNTVLLDSRIMLTHYSAEFLFSAQARQAFVDPDVQAIPPPTD